MLGYIVASRRWKDGLMAFYTLGMIAVFAFA
jgi:hypothetical protein